jgi:hypothetical protein
LMRKAIYEALMWNNKKPLGSNLLFINMVLTRQKFVTFDSQFKKNESYSLLLQGCWLLF